MHCPLQPGQEYLTHSAEDLDGLVSGVVAGWAAAAQKQPRVPAMLRRIAAALAPPAGIITDMCRLFLAVFGDVISTRFSNAARFSA